VAPGVWLKTNQGATVIREQLKWSVSSRISGAFRPESLEDFAQNVWSLSARISGVFRPEYARKVVGGSMAHVLAGDGKGYVQVINGD